MAILLEDSLGRPKPQYENTAGTDFEAWKGANGHGNVRSSDGQLITVGSKDDSAAADHTVSASVVAVLKAILRDVGGSGEGIDELLDRMGEAVASPDAHTQLARLQAIMDRIGDAVEEPSGYTLLARIQVLIDLLNSLVDEGNVRVVQPKFMGRKSFASEYDSAQSEEVVVSPAAGKRIVVKAVTITTDAASGSVKLSWGTAGAPIAVFFAGGQNVLHMTGVEIAGGVDDTVQLDTTTLADNVFVAIDYEEV